MIRYLMSEGMAGIDMTLEETTGAGLTLSIHPIPGEESVTLSAKQANLLARALIDWAQRRTENGK